MPRWYSQSSSLTINNILSQINIPDFAARRLPPPAKKERKNWLYDCPRCGEPGIMKVSFSPGAGGRGHGPWVANCCGEKGNLFGLLLFLGVVNGKDEAAKLLKEEAGIPDDANRGAPRTPLYSSGRTKGNQGEEKKWARRNRGPLPVPPPSSAKIYQRMVELTSLTDQHREELKKKRGFTDEVIDRLKFRSGGEYVVGILNRIREEFAPDEIALSGVMVKQNNTLIPCEQLLQNKVIIPYLGADGSVCHLRPHKLGFPDVAPQIYHPYSLRGGTRVAVLTEGEFKAAALAEGWGISAVAVPGVSSFAGRYFDRLTGLLREAGVEKVIIVYDNEEKGDPSLPNFKERMADRFDTQFWAYVMAYKMGRADEGFQVLVGTLPNSWRTNGKIDFDTALSQGRTREDIDRVIQAAVPPREYLDTLPEEAKPIVQRKIAQFFARFAARREYNKYIATRVKGEGKSYEEAISNFVINIKNSFYTGDGVIRNIELVNEFGEVSENFALEPEHMASGDAFKKFCFSKGNYIFKGTTGDLINIWELEFSREAGTVIHVPEKIGRINDTTWLFGNMAIKGGKVYRPGEDGVIWVDGEGYKPQSLHLGPRDEPTEDAIPCLYDGPVDILDIAEKFRLCVGGYEAWMGIGWVVMTIFSKDIFAKYKCLPFLFPHGKRESGKSSFLRWVTRFFGIESDGFSLPETTQNYVMRALGYFSSLGVWFDEYRNDPQVTKKDGYLRSAYNRQLSGKGIKNTFGARGYDVVGTIAIAGEEVPKDSGLFTRSCFVHLSSNRRDREYYDEMNVSCEKFSGFVFHLITNYEKYKNDVLMAIAAIKKTLIGLKISDRTAENWAIMAGCFMATVKNDKGFALWVAKTCQELKVSGENDHALNQFWDDVNYLVSSHEIVTRNFMEYRDGRLIIWYRGLYGAWAIHYRKKTGREPFDWKSIASYLKDEPYFVETKTAKINAANKHCYFIDPDKAPDNIKEIVWYLERASLQCPAPSEGTNEVWE